MYPEKEYGGGGMYYDKGGKLKMVEKDGEMVPFFLAKYGGRTGGGGEADSDDALIVDGGRMYEKGGRPPRARYQRYKNNMRELPYDRDPMQREFARDQERSMQGLSMELNDEVRRFEEEENARLREGMPMGRGRDARQARRAYRREAPMMAAPSDVDVLMSMLARGTEERGGETLSRDAMVERGKKRRTLRQLAPLLGMALGGYGGAGLAAQSKAQNSGVDMSYGRALLAALGL